MYRTRWHKDGDSVVWGHLSRPEGFAALFYAGTRQCLLLSPKSGDARVRPGTAGPRRAGESAGERGAHLTLRTAGGAPSGPAGWAAAAGPGRGGRGGGCRASGSGLNDAKQSGAPWRLGTITFNYNNWCLSPGLISP